MRSWRPRPPRSRRLGRLLRGWRPDRNPLRRGSDRAETAILALLVAAFLACAPIAWHFAGSWTYQAYEREAQAQRATVHLVPATVLRAAPGWTATGADPDVLARWRAPDGRLRTGPVFVPGGAAAGRTVHVWIDQAGQISYPPLQQVQVISRAQLARMLAVIALGVMATGAGVLAHRALDRRRLAGWEAEWLAKGPDWSPR